MSRFQRPHVNALISRLTESPDRIIALFGPRQTGKTTIVRQALLQVEQGRRYLAVDEPDSTALRIPSDLSDWDTVQLPQVRNTEWLVRNWVEARRPGGAIRARFRVGLRRNPEDSRMVEYSQGPVGRRPRKGLPFARCNSGIGAFAHPIRIEREPCRPLRANSGHALVVLGNVPGIWLYAGGISLLWRLSRRCEPRPGSGPLARLHPSISRRAEYRARHTCNDAGR